MQIELPKAEIFYEDDNYKVLYQDMGEWALVHVYVYNWGLSVLKHQKRKFLEFKEYLANKGFKTMATFSKNLPYCYMFNGTFLYEQDGYEVIVWELKQ